MKSRDYRDFLHDILEAIADIETFVDDLSYEEFVKDRKTLNAVVRSIEVIGEAAKNTQTKSRQNTKIYLGNGWQA
jgi:uncharacterized protein with HEPN domain